MRHPLNRSFAWEERRGPFRRISLEQARSFDERGYFVLENAFDGATIRRVTAQIDPLEERTTAFLRAQKDGKMFVAQADAITFSVHLVKQSELLRAFCAGQVFQDLAWDLIGPDVRLYWDQAVYKKPELEREFPWHQDNGYSFVEPQAYLTCWIALTDTDVDNGCPWVVPGVHRLGTLAHTLKDVGWQCFHDPPSAEALPVRAGSIAVFSSLTPHRTGPNRTDRVRKAYIVQLAPEGARMITSEPGSGSLQSIAQNDPERQFAILYQGAPPKSESPAPA